MSNLKNALCLIVVPYRLHYSDLRFVFRGSTRVIPHGYDVDCVHKPFNTKPQSNFKVKKLRIWQQIKNAQLFLVVEPEQPGGNVCFPRRQHPSPQMVA